LVAEVKSSENRKTIINIVKGRDFFLLTFDFSVSATVQPIGTKFGLVTHSGSPNRIGS